MIKTPDIGDKQVTERKLADGSVTSSKLSTEIANMLSLLTTRISAFKVADNLSSLPTEENTIGWLVDNHLYVYVGNGSTPESGMYQDCGELRGPQGIQGEQGLSGLNGKSAYDIWTEQPGNEDKSEIDFLEFTRGSKGDKGDQGERGYDISNIEQIVKSTEDGGKNIIRVTRSDGWSKVFEIFNGSKGSKGDKGTSIVKLEQTRKTTESSGLNTIEATLGDGTKESFEIYNGAKGEQGDKGEKGDKGDQGEIGPQGNSGIADASNKTLVNDAITGGETDFLSAEVGKLGILTYDCSKGGSVTHSTLQDAINSVPTTFQKVGLTITYKSGDTIYRYTLKANAWSADPANWFSVEDKLSDLEKTTIGSVPFIKEILLPKSIDYNTVDKIRFLRYLGNIQIFLINKNGTNIEGSTLQDENNPVFVSENNIIYRIANLGKIKNGEEYVYNIALSKENYELDNLPEIAAYLRVSSLSNNVNVNMLFEELYISEKIDVTSITKIRIVNIESIKGYQLFFFKNEEQISAETYPYATLIGCDRNKNIYHILNVDFLRKWLNNNVIEYNVTFNKEYTSLNHNAKIKASIDLEKVAGDIDLLATDLSYGNDKQKLRFVKNRNLELHNGYYNNKNVFVESDYWFYKALNIEKNVTYMVSALSGNNGYVPQITYFNTGVPFANECITGDTQNFVGNFLCTIPSGTTSFVVHGNKHDFIPAIYEGHLDGKSAFYDRSIVWFGTSIPAGDIVDKTDKENNFSKKTLLNYPSLVGLMLRARVFNEAIGGSMVRAGSLNRTSEDKYGWYGINAFLAATCLAGNLEEKKYFIDNYESLLKDKFSTPLEDNINDIKDFILDSSYEKRLVERHLGNNRKNLYVFDCGFNDKSAGLDLSAIPTENEYDRNYFIGAMKFLIRLILQDNPDAKIVLIGHYCAYDFDGQSHVCDAQEKLAKELNIPLIKMWEKININRSRSIQITVNKKWSDYNCLVDSDTPKTGGPFEFLMKDGLHPHSDATNSLNIEIANILADEINRLFI